MQKITPFLWFDNNAEEAMNFYVSVFRNAKILDTTHLPDLRTGGKESFLIGTIQIEGQNFMVMNGGPHYTFTPAISLFVNCENQLLSTSGCVLALCFQTNFLTCLLKKRLSTTGNAHF